MTDPENFDSDELLVRYHLGELSPRERDTVEDRYFADDAFHERVLATEEELIDSYLRDELSSAQRKHFEDWFLPVDDRRKRLEFARALAQIIPLEQTNKPEVTEPLVTSQREHTTQIADAAPFILPPERDWAPTTWAASALVFLLVAFGAYYGAVHQPRFGEIVAPATLAIEGALTGTRVSTGGRVLGVTDSGGEFRIELQAGSYTVVLSKEGYRPRTISQELSRGTAWTIGPPQSRLELSTGKLVFQKDPPSWRVSLRIQQTAGIPMNLPSVYEEVPSELVLPAGRYDLVFNWGQLPLPPGLTQYHKAAQGDKETVELIDSQVLTINIGFRQRIRVFQR